MEILKLSIKYDIPLIQKDCEVHLIQSEKCPKMELLELADQLGLQKLAVNIYIYIYKWVLVCYWGVQNFNEGCIVKLIYSASPFILKTITKARIFRHVKMAE
jgi:hypothetical protein